MQGAESSGADPNELPTSVIAQANGGSSPPCTCSDFFLTAMIWGGASGVASVLKGHAASSMRRRMDTIGVIESTCGWKQLCTLD
jgi:hypothetical protein